MRRALEFASGRNTMDFEEVLKQSSFCLHLESDTKEGIIDELLNAMVRDGSISDRDAARQAVMEREDKMSTGMQFGVAIPHGKTATIDHLATAFGLKPEGVDFNSLDGEPSRIFVMTVSSTNRTGPHIKYLAQIGKMLNRPDIREKLLHAENVEQVIEMLTGGEDGSGS